MMSFADRGAGCAIGVFAMTRGPRERSCAARASFTRVPPVKGALKEHARNACETRAFAPTRAGAVDRRPLPPDTGSLHRKDLPMKNLEVTVASGDALDVRHFAVQDQMSS